MRCSREAERAQVTAGRILRAVSTIIGNLEVSVASQAYLFEFALVSRETSFASTAPLFRLGNELVRCHFDSKDVESGSREQLGSSLTGLYRLA